jgi:hypothetical protein
MARLPDGHIDAISGLVGLEITEAQRPGVAQFLELAAEMAEILETVPLDDAHLILAPVHTLPDTEDGP